MNIEYLISRGVISLGIFTFGVAIAHPIDFLFDYWGGLTAISTLGLLIVAFLARKDYKFIKHHELQINLLNKILDSEPKISFLQLIRSIQSITRILFEILDSDNQIDYSESNDLLKQYQIEINDYYSNLRIINRIGNKIKLLENNEKLKNIFSKIEKDINKFTTLIIINNYENTTHQIRNNLLKSNEITLLIKDPFLRNENILNIKTAGETIEDETITSLQKLSNPNES